MSACRIGTIALSLVAAALWLGQVASAQPNDAAPKEDDVSAAEDHPSPTTEGSSTADHDNSTEAEHATNGHAEHDPYDLGHANATPAMNQPQEWRFDLALFTFVVFLILLAILTKFAWGPIAAALERREETIARQLEEARLASERAAVQLREYEARLAAATDEARQIVAGARKDAEVAKERILVEAQEAAARERERAVADISMAKNQALQEIAHKSVHTAVALASNIIRREVQPQEHDALIAGALDEFSKLN